MNWSKVNNVEIFSIECLGELITVVAGWEGSREKKRKTWEERDMESEYHYLPDWLAAALASLTGGTSCP